jgi:hypothetical protein
MGNDKDLTSSIVTVGFQCMLHECPHCGHPVPLNGPLSKPICSICQASLSIPDELWIEAFEAVSVSTLVDRGGEARLSKRLEVSDSAKVMTLKVDRRLLSSPRCLSCGGDLEVDDESYRQPVFEVICSSCGRPTRFSKPPFATKTRRAELSRLASLEFDVPAEVTHIAAPEQETPSGAGQPLPVWQATIWNVSYLVTPGTLRRAGRRGLGCALIGGGIGAVPLMVGLALGVRRGVMEDQRIMAMVCGLVLLVFTVALVGVVGSSLLTFLRYRRLASRFERAS